MLLEVFSQRPFLKSSELPLFEIREFELEFVSCYPQTKIN